MHTSCGEHWNSHPTHPMNIFGCRYLNDNYLTGPIPDSIGNLASLKNMWATHVWQKSDGPSHKACLNTLGIRFIDCFVIRFLQQRWQTSYGPCNNLSCTDLRVRGFEGCISESIGNLTFNFLKRVTLSQWSHCEPWKDCFEVLLPWRWGGFDLKNREQNAMHTSCGEHWNSDRT